MSELQTKLEQLQPDDRCIDDYLAINCCRLALVSVQQGCYGVGAVLADTDGNILAEGNNQVFRSGFLSSAHAEMRCLDQFENEHPNPMVRAELTLFVSLEPCPMCLSRILLSGIGAVKYLLPDPDGGMANRVKKLPPVFRNLATVQRFQQAEISDSVRQVAQQLSTYEQEQFRQQWRDFTGH